MNSASQGSDARLAVGVYDEPELIVSGVQGMLTRSGPDADVVTISAEATEAEVDVLLCDPVGRTMQLEDYLAQVVGLTRAPVIVFTWSSSRANQRRAIAAGARGFVSKLASAEDLADGRRRRAPGRDRGARARAPPRRTAGWPSSAPARARCSS